MTNRDKFQDKPDEVKRAFKKYCKKRGCYNECYFGASMGMHKNMIFSCLDAWLDMDVKENNNEKF